jgi:hypothetical protein
MLWLGRFGKVRELLEESAGRKMGLWSCDEFANGILLGLERFRAQWVLRDDRNDLGYAQALRELTELLRFVKAGVGLFSSPHGEEGNLLHAVALGGWDAKLVRALVEGGVDVNELDRVKSSPLDCALRWWWRERTSEAEESVRLLVSAGGKAHSASDLADEASRLLGLKIGRISEG